MKITITQKEVEDIMRKYAETNLCNNLTLQVKSVESEYHGGIIIILQHPNQKTEEGEE